MGNMPIDRTSKAHSLADSTPTASHRAWEKAPSEADIKAGKSALMLGHQGGAVSRLQALLNQAGASPHLEVDGKMGPATERAVVRFQRKRDLDDDGMVPSSARTRPAPWSPIPAAPRPRPRSPSSPIAPA